MEDVVAEARALAEAGCRELVLIAQDVTCYGLDLYGEYSLAKLLKFNRLQYNINSPQPESFLGIFKGIIGSDNDHLAVFHFLYDFKSIHIGHMDIHKYQIRLFSLYQIPSISSVLCRACDL